MAQNTTLAIPAATWTELTDANVTAITFQNIGGSFVLVKATTDTTAPTTDAGAIRYNPGQGERNVAISDLFPGLSGAVRLWAWSDAPQPFKNDTRVVVSHA
jgi:hypothetical protein